VKEVQLDPARRRTLCLTCEGSERSHYRGCPNSDHEFNPESEQQHDARIERELSNARAKATFKNRR
jgi:hypothetical protein